MPAAKYESTAHEAAQVPSWISNAQGGCLTICCKTVSGQSQSASSHGIFLVTSDFPIQLIDVLQTRHTFSHYRFARRRIQVATHCLKAQISCSLSNCPPCVWAQPCNILLSPEHAANLSLRSFSFSQYACADWHVILYNKATQLLCVPVQPRLIAFRWVCRFETLPKHLNLQTSNEASPHMLSLQIRYTPIDSKLSALSYLCLDILWYLSAYLIASHSDKGQWLRICKHDRWSYIPFRWREPSTYENCFHDSRSLFEIRKALASS